MIQNYDVDIKDFLKLTNSGLKVADFVQVKEAIVKRYKQIYGSDIDVSTASADGVFVNELSLIMNNILQTVSTIYANLDVESATGVYLDILCRLSNVARKQASNSSADLLVTNLNTDSSIVLPAKMEFFDNTGVQWVSTNTSSVVVPAGKNVALTVICSELGQVTAPAGSIVRAVDATLNISIVQEKAASVGEDIESDARLRARRAQSSGAQGVTVLESMVGALREISSIDDCKIYNNASSGVLGPGQAGAPLDNTSISPHSIYVIIRKKQNSILENSVVGTIIYEKLTPGIHTTPFVGASTNGENKTYEYVPTVIGTSTMLFHQIVNWKECVSIAPELDITIRPGSFFNADLQQTAGIHLGSDDEFAQIAAQVMNYMNSLEIGATPSDFDLMSEVIYSDPTFKGQSTFSVVSITSSSQLTNPDTYYNYTSFTVTSNGDNTYTITLR